MKPDCPPVEVTVTIAVEQDTNAEDIIRRVEALYDAAMRRGLGFDGFTRALPFVDGLAGAVNVEVIGGQWSSS